MLILAGRQESRARPVSSEQWPKPKSQCQAGAETPEGATRRGGCPKDRMSGELEPGSQSRSKPREYHGPRGIFRGTGFHTAGNPPYQAFLPEVPSTPAAALAPCHLECPHLHLPHASGCSGVGGGSCECMPEYPAHQQHRLSTKLTAEGPVQRGAEPEAEALTRACFSPQGLPTESEE